MYLLEEWTSLHQEHIEAWRTAQEVRSNTKRLLQTRLLIREQDHEQFETRVGDIRTRAVKSLADFLKLQRKLTSGGGELQSAGWRGGPEPSSLPHGRCTG